MQAPLARIVVFNFGSEAVQILGDLGYALVKAKHGQMFFGAGKGLNAAVEFVQRKRPCVLYFFSDDIGNACGPDRSGGGVGNSREATLAPLTLCFACPELGALNRLNCNVTLDGMFLFDVANRMARRLKGRLGLPGDKLQGITDRQYFELAPRPVLPLIEETAQAIEQLQDIKAQRKEHFVALYLNARHELIHKEIVSIGTANASIVHPRDVFAPAIVHNATAVIVAHNHPSGDATPSPEDRVSNSAFPAKTSMMTSALSW